MHPISPEPKSLFGTPDTELPRRQISRAPAASPPATEAPLDTSQDLKKTQLSPMCAEMPAPPAPLPSARPARPAGRACGLRCGDFEALAAKASGQVEGGGLKLGSRRARAEGFDAVGIATPGAIREAGAELYGFLEAGFHGGMAWLGTRQTSGPIRATCKT